MTTFTEAYAPGEFLISQAEGMRSRDNGTVRIGSTLVAGQVLGKLANGQWGALEEAATNGLQTPAGICYAPVTSGAATAAATIVTRDCEVKVSRLTWPSSYNAGDITTARATLATLGIICRD